MIWVCLKNGGGGKQESLLRDDEWGNGKSGRYGAWLKGKDCGLSGGGKAGF